MESALGKGADTDEVEDVDQAVGVGVVLEDMLAPGVGELGALLGAGEVAAAEVHGLAGSSKGDGVGEVAGKEAQPWGIVGEQKSAAGPDIEMALGEPVGKEEASEVQGDGGLGVVVCQPGVVVHRREKAGIWHKAAPLGIAHQGEGQALGHLGEDLGPPG